MRFRFMLAGVAVGAVAGMAVSEARQWRRTWGIDPDETTRVMPGDDVVGDPVASETRGITIAATPDRIWPWLVQMGFGKAGWYSYDQLDQRGASADEIVEAWGAIKVGDIIPTHPGGGFGPQYPLRLERMARVIEQVQDRLLAFAGALAPTRVDLGQGAGPALGHGPRAGAGRGLGEAHRERNGRRVDPWPRGVGRAPEPDPAAVLGELGVRHRAPRGRPIAPGRTVPRLVWRVRCGIARRDAGRRLRRLRDDAAPDDRHPHPR